MDTLESMSKVFTPRKVRLRDDDDDARITLGRRKDLQRHPSLRSRALGRLRDAYWTLADSNFFLLSSTNE